MRAAIILALAGCWRSRPAEPIEHIDPVESIMPRDAAPAVDAGLPDPTRDCPTGVGVVGRIVALSISGSATIVTIAAGQAQGVDASWNAKLQQPPDRACLIASVAQHTTKLECGVTPDQVKAGSPFALLCAP